MDINDIAGYKVEFNFISSINKTEFDGCYQLDEKIIRELLKKIHKRGHLIGLHGSYESMLNTNIINSEFKYLQQTCVALGINQKKWGNRQHYLRINTKNTLSNLDNWGISHDSSIGFAEHIGFRAGICFAYPAYDLIARKTLNIIEYPLIMMECSIISKKYMNLGYSLESSEKIEKLMEICNSYKGTFSILWHNSHFNNQQDMNFYKKIIFWNS